jgi:glycosyltransferase involved in cell wall biosynthesis
MHLAILTQYFPPEMGAPQTRLSELTERIVRAGHQVTVLTAMPNYPHGKIQEGYGGWFKEEYMYGAHILRAFIYPTQRADFLHRLSNYFSFVFSSAMIGTFKLPHVDYLMVQSPPLFLGLSGIWLSRIKRTRMIFNVSDLYPESAVKIGVIRENSTFYRVAQKIEELCYKAAWAVSGQSKSIVADINRRFPTLRTMRISNGVDTNLFAPTRRDESTRQWLKGDSNASIIVSYIGLHGLAQGLEQIVNAASHFKDDPDIRFVFIGDGVEKPKLKAQAEAMHCDNIAFYEAVAKVNVPAAIASSDIMLASIKGSIPGMVPVKLYEAMACARPVILVAKDEAADIVREHECGVVVEPGDIDGIAKAIELLRNEPERRRQYGENGRKAAEKFYNRDTIAQELTEYLVAHLNEGKTPQREG